jgi:NAD(P)H-hydrate epimerase
MKTVTPRQMRRYDELAWKRYGIPSLLLMENAGRAAADAASRMLGRRRGTVLCLCGKGNNGGDGFVAARHLLNRGLTAHVFCTVSPATLSGDALLNARILHRMGVRIRPLSTAKGFKNFKERLHRSGLVIDAVFGTGFHGPVPGFYASVFETANKSDRPVLAIDVPSGLNALTGAGPEAIVAARTLTLGLPKTGLFKKDGPRCAGRIEVADISLPRALWEKKSRFKVKAR